MQIVIDIPEEEYALCKKQWDTECLDTLMIAVKYGTPLPKALEKAYNKGYYDAFVAKSLAMIADKLCGTESEEV